MLFLGILIGVPPSAFLLWGFGRPVISKWEREGKPRRQPVQLRGFFEYLGGFFGLICGAAFWGLLLIGPIVWFVSQS